MNPGKIIIVSAPSGTGKSTILRKLIQEKELRLKFSISATSRKPRGEEKNGKEYYFLTEDEFKTKIENDDFIEWEEVYDGIFYGTLKSEVDRVTRADGANLIMDIDVKGALNIKRLYGDQALSVFIMPPSVEELENRLRSRRTDDEDSIIKRLAKAKYEMGFSEMFDEVVINDRLDEAVEAVGNLISKKIGCQ